MEILIFITPDNLLYHQEEEAVLLLDLEPVLILREKGSIFSIFLILRESSWEGKASTFIQVQYLHMPQLNGIAFTVSKKLKTAIKNL